MKKETRMQLRHQSHHLKPVVIIGANELTEAVHAEIERALESHDLIKIRINARDKTHRSEMVQQICTHHQAFLIQTIGHTVTIYRKSEEK